jgi:hypothetical protein
MALAAFSCPMLVESVRAQEVDLMKAKQVKAAYLYNFAKFVRWPDDAFEDEEAPVVIGVLGNDPFGRVLDDTVKGKKVGERLIQIRRFDWNVEEDRSRLLDCHVLYISASEQDRVDDIHEAVDDHPMLLVGDAKDFAANGGMIGLTLEKGRIVFQINRVAVARAGLKISARLLKLAKIVKPRRRYPLE